MAARKEAAIEIVAGLILVMVLTGRCGMGINTGFGCITGELLEPITAANMGGR